MYLTERLPRETGRDYALRMIKNNIISLELAPGSLISENELSAELGLSRTPVREALIELSKVQIIEISPQKKSMVEPISLSLVNESRFMRTVLECATVRLACEQITPKGIQTLRENLQMQKLYLADGNVEKLMEMDNAFHRIIFEIADKSQVHTQIRNFSIHYDRVRHLTLRAIQDLKVVDDHQKIAEAIAMEDAPLASALMKEHLDRFEVESIELRQQYPEYFLE